MKQSGMRDDPGSNGGGGSAAAGSTIDEAMIETLVRTFYAGVRDDALLGPVFGSRIQDWEMHMKRMVLFWSSVVLASGRYHGRPMEKHMMLPVDAAYFDRWLDLFRRCARETCPPDAAATFIERAELIARSLETGIASVHGVLLGKGERFRPRSNASQP